MDFIDFAAIQHDLNILIRLLVIIVLSGILGWERETVGKPAGFRTHILIGVGTVLFVAIGEIFVENYRQFNEQMRFDPIRIVEAIVTGISFIGAGLVFVSRSEGIVKNLTTATSVWTTSAIGMAVGLQRYFLAIVSTILIFFVLRFLTFWEDKETKKEEKPE
jgi:putative Mg2+ transporter-C (MgtC) family protein